MVSYLRSLEEEVGVGGSGGRGGGCPGGLKRREEVGVERLRFKRSGKGCFYPFDFISKLNIGYDKYQSNTHTK